MNLKQINTAVADLTARVDKLEGKPEAQDSPMHGDTSQDGTQAATTEETTTAPDEPHRTGRRGRQY